MQERALPGGDGRGMVLFIHGLWMHAASWQPWAELFDHSGYDCVMAAWPGELATADACRTSPALLGQSGIGQLAGQLTQLVASLPRAPIVIGHGVGGLLAQALLGGGVASAGIALAPAPSRLACWPAIVASRKSWPGPGIVTSYPRVAMPTAAQFRAGFASAVATGTMIHPEQIGPYLEEEKHVLAELRQQGLVREAFTRTSGHGVISILEAADLEEARTQMNRLPFVTHGLMTFDYTEITEL